MIGKDKEKDAHFLFNEIITNNPDRVSFIFKILEIFDEITSKESNLIIPEKNIENYIKNQISEIKKKIQDKKLDKDSFYKRIIPIIILSNKYIFNYEPRKIQIIALLLFLYKERTKGLIEQIPTGEGKTSISSFLAIIEALKGKKVDIITSSLVLAERDATLLKNFYNLFGLTVDYCRNLDPKKKKKNKYLENECYTADILYGDTLSFEGDILRTNFMEMVGRGKRRPYDCLIIDEIDNICIDNIKNITELLDDFHGYRFLEYIYLIIYSKLKEMDKEFRKNMEKKNFSINMLINKKEIVEILEKKAEEIIDFQKLKECKKNRIILPEHLNNFVKNRMRKWCESAFDAMYIYEKDKQYIISKSDKYGFDTIKPVDFFNTGVIEENSVWNGLHQFLEIKEGLRLTEENLNSCYMSNLTFFKKYITKEENNIYGLTGTLGSKKAQEALKILYNLELLFIPSFKESKLKTYKELILNNQKEFENTLFEKIKYFALIKKRAVLVIFKYINEVNKMYNYLIKRGISKNNLIQYSRNDLNEEQNFLKNEIKPGKIILSTNLSGRGTDIKISKELEKNKGLHVILTFVPISERIERQAFGRAGRKGEQGSGQYIIMSNEKFSKLIDERNKKEENEYKYLINSYQKKIDLFQEIFEDFSNLLFRIKADNKVDQFILLDLKERWGLFLIENDLSKIEKEYKDENSLKLDKTILEKTRENYKKFKESIIENIKNKYEFLNPLILSKTLLPENCDKAIKRSPFLTLGAYLYRTYLKSQNIKNQEEYINFAIDNFKNLDNCCNILNNQFKIYAELMKKIGIKEDSDLFKQNNEKMNFLNIEILTLIKKNISVLRMINDDKENYKIYAKRIYLVEINKDSNGNKKYSQDIIDYFKDFGGICLFEIKYKKYFLKFFKI